MNARSRSRTASPWRFPLGVFIATLLVAVTGTAAGAYWTAAGVPLGATVTAASANATLSGASGLQKQYLFTGAGAASTPFIAPLVVSNTGTTPLAVTLAVTGVTGNTLAPNVAVTFWLGAAGACAASIPGSGTTVGTLASVPALPDAFAAVAAGSAATLCVATRLSTTVAGSQGQSVTSTFTFTGRVGTNWVATPAPGVFTQTVYRVPDPAPVGCVDGSGLSTGVVTLSWPAVSGATSYRVVLASSGAVVKASTTATSVTVNGLELGLGSVLGPGTVNVLVQAQDSVYGTTSAGTSVALRYSLVATVLQVKCPA